MTERGRVEGQYAGVDTEQRVPTQYLHVPVFEVESPVECYGRRISWRFVIRCVCDGEVG